MCYTLPRYDLRLHVEHKYPIIQIHTHYNVLVNQVSVSQVSDFILLEFNPFGDTTFDIIMLLLCLWYLMRLSANFQVTFWTCFWGLPWFVFQSHEAFHVEDVMRTQQKPKVCHCFKCRLFFCEVLSCLLLQHDTVDRNVVWNLHSRIWFRSNQHEKVLTYLVMKCQFSATSHVVFPKSSLRFFHIIVNLGKRYFCKRGRTGLHFELRTSDCGRINLKQLDNSLFSNLTTLVLWKKYSLGEPWMTLLLL